MATNDKRPLTPEEVRFIRDMSRASTSGTLYEVLGVHGESTAAEIENAFMELARRWHPDRFYSRDTADLASVIDENFATATRAYRTLRDSLKRSAYDRELAATGMSPPAPPRGVTSPSGTSSPLWSSGERPIVTTTPGSGMRSSGERALGGPGDTPAPPEPDFPTDEVHQTNFRPVSMPEIPRPAVRKPEPKVEVPKPRAPPAVAKHMQAILEQRRKAEKHFEAGKKEYDDKQFAKAESLLYLATTIDPRNAAYKDLYERAHARAKEGRARALAAQADSAANFGKVKEAIQLLKQATEADPPEGAPFYKLAQLLRIHEDDTRGALTNLRKAAQKDPRNVTYRLALGEMYASIDLKANALREAQAVLALEPKNAAAKALLKKLK
jgi:tetratricopeptide (TPR) repeat protein